MDSTRNVVVEEKQAANPCPSSTDDDHHAGGGGGGGGDDLISCLCDDVLLRILALLGDAREVVRTGALSRRWRGLWARGVPALLFNSDLRFESPRVAERFVAFVDGVLALRARSDCGIDRVEILLRLRYGHGEPHVAPSCARAVERWILYAVQHALTSFVFQVRVIPKKWLDEQEGIVIYNGGGGGCGDDEENEVMFVKDGRLAMMEEEDKCSNGDGDEAMDNQNGDECDNKELTVTTTVIALDGDGDGDGEENEMVLAEWTDDDDDDGSDEEVMPPVTISLDELPSSTKLETMRLFLGGARVRLPSTAVFTSLTDLALECMEIAAAADGGGNLLARLLSPASCPRLQKLRLWNVQLTAEMELLLLESDTLTDLTMEGVDKLKSLELRTPNLLGLVIQECDDLETVTVSAPKLKELACAYDPSLVAIHGDLPPCLSRLKVDLCSHDYSDDDILDDTSIDLLRRCTSAKSLVVFLYIPGSVRGSSSWVDFTKDKIPKLPHVTSLEIHVHHMCERHSTGDGASSLLTRFNNLRHLVLQLDELEGCTKTDSMCPESGDDSYYVCDHPDDWSCQEISLAYLEEAEFRGLTGTDCELRFLQGMLASAVNLQKVIVRFSANYRLEDRRDDFILMMLGAAGTWTAYHDVYDQPYYEWRLSI